MSSNMVFTIKDIASRANVSVGTASRVLNGKPGVKPATRERVMRVAEELNYLPNQLAVAMKTRRSNTIGLVIADITNPFYSFTAKIIEMRALEQGYSVIICNTDNDNTIQKKIIQNLRERQVDGFIFGSVGRFDSEVEELIDSGIPLIMFHRHLDASKGTYVGCDNFAGIQQTVEHLYSIGHRRIGFVTGPGEFSTARERLQAFNEQRERFGLDMDSALIKEGGYERNKTASCVMEFLSQPDPPTAIMAANDLMALQVLDCLQKEGYRVPEDFSVTGFDDIPMASHSSIQLSTVNIDADTEAKLLIDTIIEQIKREEPIEPQDNIILETTFIPRKTTAAPRGTPLADPVKPPAA